MQFQSALKKNVAIFFLAIACLAIGRYFQLPLFLFLFPVFGMLFLRRMQLLSASILLFLASTLVIIITFGGIASHMFSSFTVYAVVMAVSTFLGMLPLLLDALLYRKQLNHAVLLLVYPCSKLFLEYAGSSNSPFGIWGSQASLLAGWTPFNNITAFTGIWGLSLLAAFLSSIIVYIIQNGWNFFTRKIAIGYLAVLLLAGVVGSIRIQGYKPDTQVKVAAIIANDSLRAEPVRQLYNHFQKHRQKSLDNAGKNYYRDAFDISNHDLLEQTAKAAGQGARLICWAEGNGVTLKEDEHRLVDSVRSIAVKWQVYIGAAIEVYTPTAEKPVENKIILVDNKGNTAFEYLKHFPIGTEKEMMVTGDGNIPTCNTPFGKVAALICFDTDFISYARKAGAAGADILLAPSNDWMAIADLRGKITRYRALENGFTLVRPASHGVTEMVSPTGKLLAANNYFEKPSRILIANVPAQNFKTWYVSLGDFLPWTFLLVLLIILGYINQTRNLLTSKFGVLLCLTSFTFFTAKGQQHHGDSLINTTAKNTVLFPAVSYAPETRLALGFTAMRFYKTTDSAKQSQLSATVLYTFNRQFINEFKSILYSNHNRYMLTAALAVNKFPERFFGIGNKTSDEFAEIISYNNIKADAALLARVGENSFIGPAYYYSQYYHIQASGAALPDSLIGAKGNMASGAGICFTLDSRDNINNSTSGWYAVADARWYNSILRSGYNYTAFNADVRKYRQLHSGAVLALQAVLNIKNGTVPFTQLSYLGGQGMMRGFYAGRFRDNDLMAMQAEYRKHLVGNWGFVLFVGAGKVSSSMDGINLKDLQHSLGFGFRRTISKQHHLNLRMDVGYGNGNCNFYINIGEAF